MDESAFLTSMVSSLQSGDPAETMAAIKELRRYLSALEANIQGTDTSVPAIAEGQDASGVSGKERSGTYKHFFSTGERVVVRPPGAGAADPTRLPATDEQAQRSSPTSDE